jgi:hypothetical protein
LATELGWPINVENSLAEALNLLLFFLNVIIKRRKQRHNFRYLLAAVLQPLKERSKIKDQRSNIKDQRSKIKNQKSKIKKSY